VRRDNCKRQVEIVEDELRQSGRHKVGHTDIDVDTWPMCTCTACPQSHLRIDSSGPRPNDGNEQ
jgi:hypothetical protein